MRSIAERVTSGKGSENIRKQTVQFFFHFYIWKNQSKAKEFIDEILSNVKSRSNDASNVPFLLRGPIVAGPISPTDPDQEASRQRAISLLRDLLRISTSELRNLTKANSETNLDEWSKDDQELAKNLVSIISSIGDQVYFASGAFGERRSQPGSEESTPTPEQQERFYRELSPVMDDLADAGFAKVAHHLLETLEFFIHLDPKGVFLRVARVVEGGQRDNYQHEPLAVDLMIRIVEKYLAEYRSQLQDPECRNALLRILDTFVAAGWTKARALTYRLDEIFR